MRRLVTLAASLLTLAGVAVLATQAAGQAPAGAGGEEAIRRAIEGLDSDDFFRREEATRRLLEAGAPAIPALVEAASSDKLEVTCRAIMLLRELLLSEDMATSEAAGQALEGLAESPVTSAALRATNALAIRAIIRSKRALAEIYRLGGQRRETLNQFFTGQPRLALGKDWTGGDEGLAHLEWVAGFDYLSIRGAPLNDAGLAHLEKLTGWSRIELYGTQISEEGATALQVSLPGSVIDHRRGGMLGIAGATDPRGCVVSRVEADSAADQVGLQMDDVITRFDGQPITSFESLTALIAKKAGGEKVVIEVWREGETLVLEPVLGEWPQ